MTGFFLKFSNLLTGSLPKLAAPALLALLASGLLSAHEAAAYMRSDYLGGWPGLCEDGQCYDDGTPASYPPPESGRRLLQHQLASPTCPTDLVYVSIQYPENLGSLDVDKAIATAMSRKFASLRRRAMELSCNDLDGCSGHCLPVGMEVRSYVHQSSPSYVSLFEVERFIGNFRRNRHYRGQVAWSFANYSLKTGRLLALKDLFPKAALSVPKLWAKVDEMLAASGNCPSSKLLLSGRRISGQSLGAKDLILTKGGATIALTTPQPGACKSQALDLSVETMLEIGADPVLWGR